MLIQPVTPADKQTLFEAFKAGKRIEVTCPWWAKDHWEQKTNVRGPDDFFDEATYRIVEVTNAA